MLRRYNEWRAAHAENLAKAKAAGIAEGKAEVYQEIAAWNARRLDAAAKGLPFNEPPPGNSTAPPERD